MNQLKNKRILLGVTGGIAAYKCGDLIRRLRERGADVRVIMTASAKSFITPLTMQALSGHPVHDDLLDVTAEAAMGHISLAKWADSIIIAPASANVLARLAQGIADDLLSTVCVATTAPISVAPAMNQAMWANAATQANVATLTLRGLDILGPAEGLQACGDVGFGRMVEPEAIVAQVTAQFSTGSLSGKHVLITAGPTHEPIDPIRYLTNRSSGKMGYALVRSALRAGATVTLVSGPVHLPTIDRANTVKVKTAAQMYEAVMREVPHCDVMISCAAVSDVRPAQVATDKIKKDKIPSSLTLAENVDIVAAVTRLADKPFTVGFAAETLSVIDYAKLKLAHKNLDMIFANTVGENDTGFDSDDNAGTLLWHGGERHFSRMPKARLADALIELIGEQL